MPLNSLQSTQSINGFLETLKKVYKEINKKDLKGEITYISVYDQACNYSFGGELPGCSFSQYGLSVQFYDTTKEALELAMLRAEGFHIFDHSDSSIGPYIYPQPYRFFSHPILKRPFQISNLIDTWKFVPGQQLTYVCTTAVGYKTAEEHIQFIRATLAEQWKQQHENEVQRRNNLSLLGKQFADLIREIPPIKKAYDEYQARYSNIMKAVSSEEKQDIDIRLMMDEQAIKEKLSNAKQQLEKEINKISELQRNIENIKLVIDQTQAFIKDIDYKLAINGMNIKENDRLYDTYFHEFGHTDPTSARGREVSQILNDLAYQRAQLKSEKDKLDADKRNYEVLLKSFNYTLSDLEYVKAEAEKRKNQFECEYTDANSENNVLDGLNERLSHFLSDITYLLERRWSISSYLEKNSRLIDLNAEIEKENVEITSLIREQKHSLDQINQDLNSFIIKPQLKKVVVDTTIKPRL